MSLQKSPLPPFRKGGGPSPMDRLPPFSKGGWGGFTLDHTGQFGMNAHVAPAPSRQFSARLA